MSKNTKRCIMGNSGEKLKGEVDKIIIQTEPGGHFPKIYFRFILFSSTLKAAYLAFFTKGYTFIVLSGRLPYLEKGNTSNTRTQLVKSFIERSLVWLSYRGELFCFKYKRLICINQSHSRFFLFKFPAKLGNVH